jgi:hypothetical protein
MPNDDEGIAWSAQHIRLSLLTQQAGALEALNLTTLTGLQPETEEKRPKEHFQRQTATFHEGSLDLRVSLLRADLFYLPIMQPTGLTPDFVALLLPGLFKDRLHEFVSTIINPVAGLEASIVRLALGATLMTQHDNLRAAYEHLKGCLHSLQVQAGEMEDLLYRVNWKVTPNIPGVDYINRLTTWSTGAARLVAVTAVSDPHSMPEQYLSQLELDISTPADNLNNISQESRIRSVRKFEEMAIENVNNGEIK